MPLVRETLSSSFSSFFASPPSTAAQCAQEWANSMSDYCLAISPPSTTVLAASSVLSSTLTSIFESSTAASATAAAMEAAWAIFAASVGVGMSPSFVPTPPPGLVGFLTLFQSEPPDTHAEAAQRFSSRIDTWIRTGTAVPSGGGGVINWS